MQCSFKGYIANMQLECNKSSLDSFSFLSQLTHFFSYFSVPVFARDNFLEIKLLSIIHYYQSRFSISMHAFFLENNKVGQLKTEPAIERQYHVLRINNIQRCRIFLFNLTFSNPHYTYIVLHKVIQKFSFTTGVASFLTGAFH